MPFRKSEREPGRLRGSVRVVPEETAVCEAREVICLYQKDDCWKDDRLRRGLQLSEQEPLERGGRDGFTVKFGDRIFALRYAEKEENGAENK